LWQGGDQQGQESDKQFALITRTQSRKAWLKIGETFILFHIDTGAEYNVLDEDTFSLLCPQPRLKPCTTVLKAYGVSNS